MKHLAAYPLIVACCVSTSTVAMADPSAEDKLTAKALFEAAQELRKEGKFEDACPKLAESQRLDPSMGTEFYLADCHERVGKIASAWIYYEEVAGLAHASGLKDREAFARKRADALKPRIPKLMIEVAEQARGGGPLILKRDQVEVSRHQIEMPIPMDPGTHTISAEAKGKKRWSETVDVKEGATTTVRVPPLEDEGAPSTPPPAPRPAPTLTTVPSAGPPMNNPPPARSTMPTPVPAPAERQAGSSLKTAGFIVGAAGIAGLGVGFGLGGLAMTKNDASNESGRCNELNQCTQEGKELRNESLQAATVSTVGFVAGGVLLAGGVVMILVAPSSQNKVGLSLGPQSASVVGRW
ncbi:MAG: hypothetical protein U0359_24490 [Byssovorax sp.]